MAKKHKLPPELKEMLDNTAKTLEEMANLSGEAMVEMHQAIMKAYGGPGDVPKWAQKKINFVMKPLLLTASALGGDYQRLAAMAADMVMHELKAQGVGKDGPVVFENDEGKFVFGSIDSIMGKGDEEGKPGYI